MANPKGNPNIALHGFKKGESGNPAGKPIGARNELAGDFVKALSADFREHGKEALEKLRLDRPDVYIKVIAELMPKLEEKTVDVNLNGTVEHRSVQEVTERISDLLTTRQGGDKPTSMPH